MFVAASSHQLYARPLPEKTNPSELARIHSTGKPEARSHAAGHEQRDAKTVSPTKAQPQKGASSLGRDKTGSATNRTAGRAHARKDHHAKAALSPKKKKGEALSSGKKHTSRTRVTSRHAGKGGRHSSQARHTAAHVSPHEKPALVAAPQDITPAGQSAFFKDPSAPDNEHETDKLTRNVILSAYRYLGSPYRYGGTSPSGFDCSGFVRYVFEENGISLSRSSRTQVHEGMPVDLSSLKPGDLVFFKMRRGVRAAVDHVGIYVGEGFFIHASSRGAKEISLDSLESSPYRDTMVGARRILESPSDESFVVE